MSDLLLDWRPEHAELFGRHPLWLRHALGDSGLFTDESLAALIERCPPSHYDLRGASGDGPPDARGVIGVRSGPAVITSIRAGKLRLDLRRVGEIDGRFADLAEAIFAELERKAPRLKATRRDMSIVISSPRVQDVYAAEAPVQSLWQVRGRRRVLLYPRVEPFIRKRDVEDMALGLAGPDIAYEPWFDDHATVYDLEPGEMLAWPLDEPHRIVNENVLNVSVAIEHVTPEIEKLRAVRYGNALLRRHAGLSGTSEAVSGPGFLAKAGLAAAHRALFGEAQPPRPARIDFVLGEHDAPALMHAAE